MNNISNNDIFTLARIASLISMDKFKELDKTLNHSQKLKIKPVKIYETILQSYLFCGFPAAIESLKIFKKHFPVFNKTVSPYIVSKFKLKGISNCKLIYRNNYRKLIENIKYLSPDLNEWMIIEGYGKVFGRDGLTLLEREFVNVAILSTRFYENQLHSHIRGALHLNATKDQIKTLIGSLKGISSRTNINKSLKMIDQIVR